LSVSIACPTKFKFFNAPNGFIKPAAAAFFTDPADADPADADLDRDVVVVFLAPLLELFFDADRFAVAMMILW
jgi:hypothetical protein